MEVRNRDLTEALEQQTATSEVLRVIASSPTELQPVLDTVIANAVRIVGAKQGHIRQYDGEFLRLVAHYNESPETVALLKRYPRPPVSESSHGRAFLERRPIQRTDAQADPGYQGPVRQGGARTALAVPLLREGSPIGTMLMWRDFVEPFTPRQVELVQTFADQAVIAIENVRLFQELTDALERQTATSEILGVIASSPTDIDPVLDTVAKNAARVCGADDALIWRVDGTSLQLAAKYGSLSSRPVGGVIASLQRGGVPARAVLDRETIHVHDISAVESDFPGSAAQAATTGARTMLAAPLLREDIPIGVIFIRRTEVRPFTDSQIKLLESFADQAVIAIENVRLFQELQARNRDLTEALEQQTATSEILRVIASSPTDIQPVLDVVAENAARLCGATDAVIYRVDGERHLSGGGFRFHAAGADRNIHQPQNSPVPGYR